ncbi:AbrB/MazE/SpoVT family DNA-binding domain-containing protein [Candidatus Woesearchaeota archaeon]|nr:AbrB/MazE/SpoVT family DNA-binding domain-containing protein [Candidatus Woesearchaeota archaeon]
MKRSLIKQKDSFTITLPKKWVEQRGLEQGDEIELDQSGSKLVISAKGGGKKECELKLEDDTFPLIRIRIHTLYNFGYDRITIHHQKEHHSQIKKIISRYLLGFEITETSEKKTVIESVTEPSEDKQQTILKRMFQITMESLDQTEEDIEEARYEKTKHFEQWDEKMTQYTNFLRRNISKKRFTEERVNYYWELYFMLNAIQTSVLYLYRNLDKHKPKISKQIMQGFRQIKREYAEMHTSFLAENIPQLEKVHNEIRYKLYMELQDMMAETRGAASVILSYMTEICRIMHLATYDMIAISTSGKAGQ